jgi:hypothetical protein
MLISYLPAVCDVVAVQCSTIAGHKSAAPRRVRSQGKAKLADRLIMNLAAQLLRY